jgi:hypothetical protein
MKTLLGIDGETYLLPETKDLAKVLEVLKGITPVRHRTVYGPEGENRYSEAHGYCTKEVLDPQPARLRVEIVMGEDVVTQSDFDRLTAKANLPETVG